MAGIISLEALLCDISHCPMTTDFSRRASHVLILDAFRLVARDCIAKHDELRMHMKEACQRLGALTILQITELLRVSEAVNREREEFVKLIELAVSMHLLHPKACLADNRILTDNELMNIKVAFTEAARVSTPALAMKSGRAPGRKEHVSIGSVLPVKVLSLGILKGSEVASRG
ncbi:hypothetical protein L7F22_057855 [Adiantum nelumboides]|nr:hypothetical protein [Adiantum nelumboides]